MCHMRSRTPLTVLAALWKPSETLLLSEGRQRARYLDMMATPVQADADPG